MVNRIGLVLSHDDAIKVTMHRKLYRTLRNLLTSKRNVVLVILVIFLLFHLFPRNRNRKWSDHGRDGGGSVKHVSIPDSLTIVVREYEDFDNRLYKTIVSANGAGIPSVVVGDDVPYPPVKLPKRTIVMTLNTSPGQQAWKYQEYIRTSHVAIIPDGCYVSRADSLIYMMSRLNDPSDDVKVIAAPCVKPNSPNNTGGGIGVGGANKKQASSTAHLCQGLSVDLRKWTLSYYDSTDFCDSLTGPHILIMTTKDLLSFPYPFTRPMQDAIFIQSALRKWKVTVFNEDEFTMDRTLYEDPHKHWKHKFRTTERMKELYRKFGIKLVQNADGTEEYHGCSRETPRCFGTVVNDMPEFLYRQRWTPPCCLKALRITGKYVFNLLQSQGVRYWLEGGSLLGAARNGDIIPWDYDIDIGIYKDDIEKSAHLTQCAKQDKFVDDDGFVWERSKESEGDFYRVQYSETNHLHVDIFPFYSRNRMMTKDTWFKTHKQDTEFPEHYLEPLTTVDFLGMQVSAPNHWKEFLEYKFGKGVIDNPKYPDENMEVV